MIKYIRQCVCYDLEGHHMLCVETVHTLYDSLEDAKKPKRGRCGIEDCDIYFLRVDTERNIIEGVEE